MRDGRGGRRTAGIVAALLALVAASGLAAPAGAVTTAAAPVRIMPIGDSITEGGDGQATYRWWLDHRLHDAGIAFDLVGSRHGVRDGLPRFADFDQDHDGHAGWRTDQILAGKLVAKAEGQLSQWAAAERPDVALVHLGTNDTRQCQTPSSTASELVSVVATLRAANPDVAVVLALIIPTTADPGRPCAAVVPQRVVELNGRIADLAASLSTARSPIVAVDQHTGFDVAADTTDGVHPDESGEQKLAARWAAALEALLGEQPPATDGVVVRATTTSVATSGRTVALPRPAGTQAGDLLVAAISVQGDQTVTTPSGWNLAPGSPTATGPEASRARQYVLWRLADAGEPDTYAFARTGSRHAAALLAIEGAAASSPVASGAATTAVATSGTAPGASSPAAGAAVLRLVALRTTSSSVSTVAPPPGLVERADAGTAYLTAAAASSTAGAGAVAPATFPFSRNAQAVLTTVVVRPG